MKYIFKILFSFFCLSLGKGSGLVFSQPNNYKPGPNKMVINLDASIQKFEVPIKDLKIKVNNEFTYSWYKSNQIMHTKGGYDGKLLHGSYAEFYLNNNLKEKGTYKKGLKNGEWKLWYENGQLKEIAKYCCGLRQGKMESFDENGILIFEASFKKGKLHGKTISYENGKILEKHNYKKGIEVFQKPGKIKKEKPSEKIPENKPAEKERDKGDQEIKPIPKDPKISKG